MVSVLDSISCCLGSSPGQGTALCSWARHFTLMVPLSTRVYTCNWVLTVQQTSIPSRVGGGSTNIATKLLHVPTETGPLGSNLDFTFGQPTSQ